MLTATCGRPSHSSPSTDKEVRVWTCHNICPRGVLVSCFFGGKKVEQHKDKRGGSHYFFTYSNTNARTEFQAKNRVYSPILISTHPITIIVLRIMTPLPPSKLQQPTAGRGRRTPRSSDDIDSMHHQNPRDLHQQQQQEHHSSSFDEKDHEHLPSLQLDHARKLLQHEHEEGKDEHHHDEVVATMRLLKQYIDTLETENDALSETCRSQRNQLEQCSPTSTASSFAMSISTISSDNSKKAVQQKEGLGWSDVAVMAKKLSVMKKENDTLKDALAVKTRQLEKSLKLNKELQTKLEKLLLQVQGPLAVEEENREVPDLSEKTTELVSQECVKPQKDNNDNTGNSNPSHMKRTNILMTRNKMIWS